MLENYSLAKKRLLKNTKSMHWDVFPGDYEKTILSFGAWETFLRNSISIGFNDELSDLENQRWTKSSRVEIDVWDMRRSHDHRTLKENIKSNEALINKFNIVSSICSPEFVLKSIASLVGSPITQKLQVNLKHKSFDIVTGKKVTKTKDHHFACNEFDLGIIYHFWQISRIMDQLIGTDRPLIAEIGPGYGLLMSKIKKKYPKSRCVLFDLPEMSAVQTYYLKSEFPEAKILFYKDLVENGESLFTADFDFMILPGQMIELMPKNCVDVFINMRSMMEMNSAIIQYYFDNINRTIKKDGIFACINRYSKNTSDEPSIFKNYPYDDYWSIVLSQTSRMQNHIHELIVKRISKKSDLPVSQALKSLPP